MNSPIEKRLSNISTNWDELIAAHDERYPDQEASELRGQILRQYSKCVYKYILGATRSHHAAEDLTQEFSLRFVRGDFKNASPNRGRFRDYLKVSLRNLVNDFFRTNIAESELIGLPKIEERALRIQSLDADFVEQWRQQVLSITWNALKEFEYGKNSQYYSILYLRTEHPTSSSEELAVLFEQETGNEVTANWVRQTLRRARLKFAELLTNEIARTLKSSSKSDINDELAELGLKKYVDPS